MRLWTFDFAKWWFICRLMEVNNFIFLRHIRGTVLLNWFYGAMVSQPTRYQRRMQQHLGARCPQRKAVDTQRREQWL